MAYFIPINDTILTYGLIWKTIDPTNKEARERAAHARELEADYFVRYEGSEIKYGFAIDVPKAIGKQQSGALVSAALQFIDYFHALLESSADNDHCLLLQQVDQDKVAMIALIKGQLFLDAVVAMEDLGMHIAALHSERNALFAIYGNVPGYAAQQNILPQDLLASDIRQTELVRFIDARQRNRIIGAAVLCFVILSAAIGWKLYADYVQDQEDAQRRTDPMKQYAAQTKTLLATARFNGPAAYDALWSVIKDKDINKAGWSLKSIKCQLNQCEEIWKQGHGTFYTLKSQLGPNQKISLQNDGETSVVTYSVHSTKTALPREQLPKKDPLWIDLVTQQQRFKRIHKDLIFTPGAPSIVGLTPLIPAASVPPAIAVYAGAVSVSAPLGLAGDLLQHYLQDVMVSEILVDVANDVRSATIKIQGTYYAQN